MNLSFLKDMFQTYLKPFGYSTCLLLVFSNLIKCQDNIIFTESDNNNSNKMVENTTNHNISTRVLIPLKIRPYDNQRRTDTKSRIKISENFCSVYGTDFLVLKCENVQNFDFVMDYLNLSISSLEITKSSLSSINLTELSGFPELKIISITHSKLNLLSGQLPQSIQKLNLSSNLLTIDKIPDSIFTSTISIQQHSSSISFPEQDMTKTRTKSRVGSSTLNNPIRNRPHQNTMDLEVIDLSHNNLSELPQSIFTLPRLKSLFLTGNKFNGKNFVWDRLYIWLHDIWKFNLTILKDADDTLCYFQFDDEAKSNLKGVAYSLLGALKAKEDLENTCGEVNKTAECDCSLHALQKNLIDGHPISHTGGHGSISITLQLDCSNRGLKTLPLVPTATWQLNVSHNKITDLSSLKNPNFKHLETLDAENNEINFNSLAGVPFLTKYRYLNLRNNHISSFPIEILESMKSVQEDQRENGAGMTFLGGNELDCDCKTSVETKTFFIQYGSKFKDAKEINCKNFKQPNGKSRSLWYLSHVELCQSQAKTDPEIWIYIMIGVEVLLIVFIIAKVWHDQVTFRRTGKLPWFSKKMPRLPCGCDTILEGIKEQNHLSHHSNNQLSQNP